MGFHVPSADAPYRLILSVSGVEKSGKTHFALTAPEPIVYIDADLGSEGVVEPFIRAGKQVISFPIRLEKNLAIGKASEVKARYDPVWQDFKKKVATACKLGTGTIVIDTATEMYELCRLAEFGKLTQVMQRDYGPVNSEWREVIYGIFDSPLSCVLIHKLGDAWRDGKTTGALELKGFRDTPGLVQCSVRMARLPDSETGEPVYEAEVENCRSNHRLTGTRLVGVLCDCSRLIKMVHKP